MSTVQIKTPASRDDPSQVKIEEIPLPPQEMWLELENREAVPAASSELKLEAAEAQKPEPELQLEFIGEGHFRVVPLKYGFRLDGAAVSSVTVRRLTIGQVDILLKRLATTTISTFEIYSEMTSLPVAVLRGLIDEDGDAVTDAAYDFLPRALKTADALQAT